MDGGFPDHEDRESRQGHERVDPRDSMLLQATMRVGDGDTSSPLRIRNLSAGGLMGEGGPLLEVGQSVSIDLRNIGTVTGKIAWTEDARFGVAFDTQIDPQLARKTVGSRAADAALVRPSREKARRPGLRIE